VAVMQAQGTTGGRTGRRTRSRLGPHYKWIALSNTTLGVLMATINSSIVLIALPDIFKGIGINPLDAGNTRYLLWMMMGYLVVTAVLVVSFGQLGDMFGRARMYNLGFAIFAVSSVLLAVTWMHGGAAAWWLIGWRIVQGIGGAFLMANSAAILTDAFPVNQRGLALGLNGIAGIAGSFLGLLIGGVLSPIDWHWVFLVSVPVGVVGAVWAYLKLHDTGVRQRARMDWWGNLTFAVGLIAVLVGITYGIQPYRQHTMGWTNPWVLGALIGGAIVLVVFTSIEMRSASPLFNLSLFRIRSFTAGNVANLMAALSRGGMQFILLIWLQGIWLPLHGYSFAQTPLWAGIYMLPMTVGFLLAAPLSGVLSDRLGTRLFAAAGMLLAAVSFLLLIWLPVGFAYWQFAALLLVNGLGQGLFSSPNRAEVMNSLPPTARGVGAGMSTTFQNSAMVLSIGIFFSLIIAGLSAHLPSALYQGLVQHDVPAAAAQPVAHLPAVAVLFAAFLGYNPMQQLLGPILGTLPADQASYLTGRSFFPHLISGPFADGLAVAFWFAFAACVLAAAASLLCAPHRRGAAEEAHESVGAELAAVAGELGTVPSGLVIPDKRAAEGVSANGAEPVNGRTGVYRGTPTMLPVADGPLVSGQVEGPGRRPVAGAVLTVTDFSGHQIARAVSDAGGGYRLPVPTGGMYMLICAAEGHQPVASVVPVGVNGARRDLTLVTTSRVDGRVLGTGGDPVAGATVTLTDVRDEVVGATMTDPDGRFVLADLYPGEYTLTATADNTLPITRAVSVDRVGSHRIDVMLRSNVRISGTVRAASSQRPVSDASVTLVDHDGNILGTALTGEDGQYEFTGLPPGAYTLTASGYPPVAVRLDLSGGRTNRT
jgi:MFS family permease